MTSPAVTRPERLDAAVRRARRLFLEDGYGCAETTLMALREALCLPGSEDASAAMALNGGVAYSGGICGALSGAAIALGEEAARRCPTHEEAKLDARTSAQGLMDAFTAAFGAVDCRALIGLDLRAPGVHEAFSESGIWRDRCMRQVEFSIERVTAGPDHRSRPAPDPPA